MPAVLKWSALPVKQLLCLFPHHSQKDGVCERWDMGGHIWKAWTECWIHGMRCLHRSEGQHRSMSHCDGSLNRIRQNGKASIYRGLWNGQHGLLMLMELAIKTLLDLCIHTLLPSKGSSFSGEGRGEGWERGRKKADRNMCEWGRCECAGYLLFLPLECVQLIIPITQNQTGGGWASANTVLIPQWTELTFSQAD